MTIDDVNAAVARTALEGLLKRLEPKVGHIRRGDEAGWNEAEVAARGSSGKGHLANAVRLARQALASDNDALIVGISHHCASLERIGLGLQARTPQKTAGKKTGAKRKADNEAIWIPIKAKYDADLAVGVPYQIARKIAVGKLNVSNRTVARHLPKPK